MRSASEDLTARARIRDAAIRRFAQDGLESPLRTIAADAGVSAGLIIHHFGSRAGLRAACDEHVLAETRSHKSDLMTPAGAGAMLGQLVQVEAYTPMIGYLLRCLQAGGELTDQLVEAMVADAVDYLAEGVRTRTLNPSRDPQARARLLVDFGLGCLLVRLPPSQAHIDLDALPAWFKSYYAEMMPAILELFTEPLLADPAMLDAYLAATHRSTP